MPRSPGPASGGIVTHVLNRSNARRPLFEHDGDLPELPHWLTVTHTQRWHAAHGTAASGHVYQGRYKSFPAQARRISRAQGERGVLDGGRSLLTVRRYVERNALRAGRVRRAEDWRWCRLWRRTRGDADQRALPADPPASGAPSGLPPGSPRLKPRPDESPGHGGPGARDHRRGRPRGDGRRAQLHDSAQRACQGPDAR